MPTYSVQASGDLADEIEAFADAYEGSRSDALLGSVGPLFDLRGKLSRRTAGEGIDPREAILAAGAKHEGAIFRE
jgi:hypothetical protein